MNPRLNGLKSGILFLTHPSWTDRTEEDELMQSSMGNGVALCIQGGVGRAVKNVYPVFCEIFGRHS